MSETVVQKVSVRKANAKEITNALNFSIGRDDYDIEEYLSDNFLIEIHGKIFKYSLSTLDSYGFTEVTEDSNKNLRFITQYYNGGCHITEIIENELKKANIYDK